MKKCQKEEIMNNYSAPAAGRGFQLMTLILSEDRTEKFMSIAKEEHLRDGISLIGKGTVSSHILNILGVKSGKRIITDILVEKERAAEILDHVSERLMLNEADRGIAYISSIELETSCELEPGAELDHDKEPMRGAELGQGAAPEPGAEEKDKVCSGQLAAEEESMFKKLTVIVNRGMAEDVMDIARRSGVKGGTVLHGRGTGSDQAAKLFGIDIEPEKELVIMIMPCELTEKVVNELFRELRLDIPGNGIVFSESVWDVRGLAPYSE